MIKVGVQTSRGDLGADALRARCDRALPASTQTIGKTLIYSRHGRLIGTQREKEEAMGTVARRGARQPGSALPARQHDHHAERIGISTLTTCQ